MRTGTEITIGLLMLIIGFAFWYLAAWYRINKSSDTRVGFVTGVGLMFSTFGFALIVDYESLSEFQFLLASFVLIGYMFVCLVASHSLINGTYPKD